MANTATFTNNATNCAAMGSSFSCNLFVLAARTVLVVGAFVLSVLLGLQAVAIISGIICAVIISVIIINVIIRCDDLPKEVQTLTAS